MSASCRDSRLSCGLEGVEETERPAVLCICSCDAIDVAARRWSDLSVPQISHDIKSGWLANVHALHDHSSSVVAIMKCDEMHEGKTTTRLKKNGAEKMRRRSGMPLSRLPVLALIILSQASP